MFAHPQFAAPAPQLPPPLPPKARRRRVPIAIAAIIAVVAATVGGFLIWRSGSGDLVEYCAAHKRGVDRPGITLFDKQALEELMAAAPRELRGDFKALRAFVEEEPDLVALIEAADTLTESEKAAANKLLDDANKKYGQTEAMTRIAYHIVDTCKDGKPK
ncbi:MAG: hypothetical protein LBE08_02685 [Bifidobacteriaceae bacterium]|nr:hypothetical protein [Bifidobacteriaceae bacterium]